MSHPSNTGRTTNMHEGKQQRNDPNPQQRNTPRRLMATFAQPPPVSNANRQKPPRGYSIPPRFKSRGAVLRHSRGSGYLWFPAPESHIGVTSTTDSAFGHSNASNFTRQHSNTGPRHEPTNTGRVENEVCLIDRSSQSPFNGGWAQTGPTSNSCMIRSSPHTSGYPTPLPDTTQRITLWDYFQMPRAELPDSRYFPEVVASPPPAFFATVNTTVDPSTARQDFSFPPPLAMYPAQAVSSQPDQSIGIIQMNVVCPNCNHFITTIASPSGIEAAPNTTIDPWTVPPDSLSRPSPATGPTQTQSSPPVETLGGEQIDEVRNVDPRTVPHDSVSWPPPATAAQTVSPVEPEGINQTYQPGPLGWFNPTCAPQEPAVIKPWFETTVDKDRAFDLLRNSYGPGPSELASRIDSNHIWGGGKNQVMPDLSHLNPK